MFRGRIFRSRASLVIAAVLVTVGVLLSVVIVGLHRVRNSMRTIYDSTHARGLAQGMVLWQQNNGDSFPLPSEYDKANKTIQTAEPSSKNTTANIYSILVFTGYCSPELFISPHESNPNVRACSTYVWEKPSAAADPRRALWDPAFVVDFTDGKIGNASYAHQIPIGREQSSEPGNRYPRWRSTFRSDIPIVASRGPKLAGIVGAQPSIVDVRSRTLGKHGPSGQWQGSVAYEDVHVNLEVSMTPPGVVYQFNTSGQDRPDVLFFDEPDSHQGLNAYLGIFPKAGPTAADFASIWD